VKDRTLIHPQDKILESLNQARAISELLKKDRKKLVVTSGAFDLIHDGHVKYVWEAKRHGDVLLVGIDSDHLVKMIKGDSRPVNSQDVRVYVMAGLGCVDYTVIHNSSLDLVQATCPDCFITSTSSKLFQSVRDDCQWVKEAGGRVITFDRMSENHTTQMIAKINGKNHS
jgi:D-glycero-beta-D-manno-heptose 1-phosphate adenylyltransferase